MSKFTIEELPDDETVAGKCNEEEGYTTFGLIKVTPSGCILPKVYQYKLEEIRNIPVRDDDVYIITNPKCGTTWSQEMIWLIGNDLDFKTANSKTLNERSPYIDIVGCVPSNDAWIAEVFNSINNLPTTAPRFIKSHLPKDLLPTEIWSKKTKIIFVARDPRDAAISNYHHYVLFHGYTGTMEEFLDKTLEDRVIYNPFWEHAIEFWNMRHEPNVLFLTYEDMKKDLTSVLQKVGAFLGKTIPEDKFPQLLDHLSFEKMKNNRMVNFDELKEMLKERYNQDMSKGSFIREGKSGGWRNNMSPEMIAKFKEWTTRKIAGTGLEEIYQA